MIDKVNKQKTNKSDKFAAVKESHKCGRACRKLFIAIQISPERLSWPGRRGQVNGRTLIVQKKNQNLEKRSEK